jgi:class I lanthipeptide synthase
MEKAINQRLKEIYNALKEDSPTNISLMDGKAGTLIFNFEYLQHTKNPVLSPYLNQIVQELAEGAIVETEPAFCNGKAGVNWVFAYLFKKDLLTLTDWQLLCEQDGELEEIAIAMIEKGNYDFLYGALGIAWYLLYTRKEGGHFFKNVFQLLQLLEKESSTKNIIPHFDHQRYQSAPDQVDMGLSHGITSILKFCLQCYKQNICAEEAKSLAERVINYLTAHAYSGDPIAHSMELISYFPNFILVDGSEDENETRQKKIRKNASDARQWPSRVAWCYGDLGIGYILYQAGIIFNNEETASFALQVLTHCTGRKTDQDTMLKDSGICHGSAGIAHIFNKVWHDTHQPVFKDACDYWIQKTLDMAIYTDGIAGYKKYGGPNAAYEKTPALIDGVAGIGLVLLSYLTSDFSWDYCFMLNN